MVRSKDCTTEEKKLIRTLHRNGKFLGEISKLIGRSRNMIANALKTQQSIETRGKLRKTTEAFDRLLFR